MKWFLNLKIGLKLTLVITLVTLISFSFLGIYAYNTAQNLLKEKHRIILFFQCQRSSKTNPSNS